MVDFRELNRRVDKLCKRRLWAVRYTLGFSRNDRKVRIFPVQVERSEGQVLDFFVIAGFEISLRTPVLPTRASSSPVRQKRRERDK